jgi:hypothetical protein
VLFMLEVAGISHNGEALEAYDRRVTSLPRTTTAGSIPWLG